MAAQRVYVTSVLCPCGVRLIGHASVRIGLPSRKFLVFHEELLKRSPKLIREAGRRAVRRETGGVLCGMHTKELKKKASGADETKSICKCNLSGTCGVIRHFRINALLFI